MIEKLPYHYTMYDFWESRCDSSYQMAAICGVTRSATTKWRASGRVPTHAVQLLVLYFGEMSLAEWEDAVEDRTRELRDTARADAKRFRKQSDNKH